MFFSVFQHYLSRLRDSPPSHKLHRTEAFQTLPEARQDAHSRALHPPKYVCKGTSRNPKEALNKWSGPEQPQTNPPAREVDVALAYALDHFESQVGFRRINQGVYTFGTTQVRALGAVGSVRVGWEVLGVLEGLSGRLQDISEGRSGHGEREAGGVHVPKRHEGTLNTSEAH